MSENSLRKKSRTDWDRLADMTDEEIDYSDIPAIDDEFFEKGKLRMPKKQMMTVPIDGDILEWFKSQRGYEIIINSVLRVYMDTQCGKRPYQDLA